MAKNGSGSSPTAINLGSLINDSPDVDDFEDALDQRNIRIIRTPSLGSPKQYQFNLIDTPGLNDTRGTDEKHIASIYKAFPDFQAAIKCYFDMFPEFHGLVAFVHTHFDYKDLHPKREEVYSHLTEKKGRLNNMMGRDTCQHFVIDCDIKSTKLIRIGITQNIIRRILSLARFNQPVAMNRVLILKSPKMRDIDNILVDRYKAILDAQRATLNSKDGTQGDILRKLYEMETRLDSLRSEERDLEDYIKEYNTSDLVMIHESTFDESWRVFQLNKDHSIEFPDQDHIIHKKNILSENVDIGKEQGGEGHSYWRMVYKRHSFEDGYLHAKLYTTRSSIYRNQISERKSQLGRLRSTLQGTEQELSQYSSKHQSETAEIQKLIEKNVLYTRLISLLSRERLSPEVFQHLIDAKSYARAPLENSETVVNVYLDVIQKGETKILEPEVQKSVKKFVDPDYTIDLSSIGDSVSSCTKDVIRSTVYTDLPVTDVVENASRSSPTEVYLGSLIDDFPNVDDFEDALNQKENQDSSVSLNDTRGRDEEHIASIFKVLRDVGRIHLVLIAIGKVPFSPGFQSAIKCYFDMFPEFHGLVAFVHTHFDYKDLHPQREKVVSQHLTAKKDTLNYMMGRDSYPHFVIDCDLKSRRPIRNCITQNIIQNILYLAPFNEPVAMNRIQIHKSPKMKVTDNILVDKYRAILGAQRETLNFEDWNQGAIFRKLNVTEAHLKELRSEERDLEKYIKEHNTSELVMIYESPFHEEWKVFHHNKIHYMEFPDQEYFIHEKNITYNNVRFVAEHGGEGHSKGIEYKRRRFKDGSLHAKFYTTKACLYRKQLSACRSRLDTRSIARNSRFKLAI
ncbi:hypothetical protein BGX26_000902 [Mortierella sp. AD094]|nr:hypothetical protein BGX26_000902 [Mortierella sp. AD094]